jgi:hypothetical protein
MQYISVCAIARRYGQLGTNIQFHSFAPLPPPPPPPLQAHPVLWPNPTAFLIDEDSGIQVGDEKALVALKRLLYHN